MLENFSRHVAPVVAVAALLSSSGCEDVVDDADALGKNGLSSSEQCDPVLKTIAGQVLLARRTVDMVFAHPEDVAEDVVAFDSLGAGSFREDVFHTGQEDLLPGLQKGMVLSQIFFTATGAGIDTVGNPAIAGVATQCAKVPGVQACLNVDGYMKDYDPNFYVRLPADFTGYRTSTSGLFARFGERRDVTYGKLPESRTTTLELDLKTGKYVVTDFAGGKHDGQACDPALDQSFWFGDTIESTQDGIDSAQPAQ